MKKIPLVLVVVGFLLVTTGIVMVFANLLQTNGYYGPIHSYGVIVHPDEEIDSTENNSETFDARGYVPIIVGVGLLSIAFLDERLGKKRSSN